MGVRFRKSFKFGPFRTTISKSGVSSSFGVKGARITRTANGKTRSTLSVPGTGLSYVRETSDSTAAPSGSGGALPAIAVGAIVVLVAIAGLSGGRTEQKQSTEQTGTARTEVASELTDEQVKSFEDAASGLLEDGTVEVLSTDTAQSIGIVLRSAALDRSVADAGGAAPSGWDELTAAAAEVSSVLLTQARDIGCERSYLQLVSGGTGEIYATLYNGKALFDKFSEQKTQTEASTERTVWVSENGKKYHYDSTCGGHSYTATTRSSALAAGLSACQKCAKYG